VHADPDTTARAVRQIHGFVPDQLNDLLVTLFEKYLLLLQTQYSSTLSSVRPPPSLLQRSPSAKPAHLLLQPDGRAGRPAADGHRWARRSRPSAEDLLDAERLRAAAPKVTNCVLAGLRRPPKLNLHPRPISSHRRRSFPVTMPFSQAYAMACIDIRSFVDGFYSFIEGVPNTSASDALLASVSRSRPSRWPPPLCS
jgi:hypothetical protein